MDYGKLTKNGQLLVCSSPTEGFLPIVESDPPGNIEFGFYATFNWVEKDGVITNDWHILKEHRALGIGEVLEHLLLKEINSMDITQQEAIRMVNFYPDWNDVADNKTKRKRGFRFRYLGKLYEVRQEGLVLQTHYTPGDGTESLYEVINDSYEGTLEDPIPYDPNMAVYKGKLYIERGTLYECTRDSGNPLYSMPSDLLGVYFVKK